MKILQFEDIPRWYTLKIDPFTGFPCIEINNNVLDSFREVSQREIDFTMNHFGLSELFHQFHQITDNEFFGFANYIRKIKSEKLTTTYLIDIPKAHYFTNMTCSRCGGSKEEPEFGGDCHYCSSTGKNSLNEFINIEALCASLSILFSELRFPPEIEYESEEKQLLFVNTIAKGGMHGHSIGGEFSPHFINFYKSQPANHRFPGVEEIMRKVSKHIHEEPSDHGGAFDGTKYSIRACQHIPGNIHLSVPGDACEVYADTSGYKIDEGRGTTFSCHNVDSALQQLIFISGLAGLCEMTK